MSEFSTFLHQIPSIYIKLHHEFDHERVKSQTEKKLGEKLSFLAKIAIFHLVCCATVPVHITFL